MAYRKQVPQSRTCVQCQAVFLTAHQSRRYCSSACNTRAWRARSAASASVVPFAGLAPLPPTSPSAAKAPIESPKPPRNGPSFGAMVAATMVGNAASDAAKYLLTPAPTPVSAAGAAFPTWPPTELLAAAGSPVWIRDAAWAQPQLLTPVPYQGHTLYLYVEAGTTFVLWRSPSTGWQQVTTRAELAQLAAKRPVSPALQALIQQYVPEFEPAQAALSAPDMAPPVAPDTSERDGVK
jgi:ribosomal protein S27AE